MFIIKYLFQIESHFIMNHSSNIIHCYGITRDPKTNTFKAVIEYAKNGNLKQYLNDNYYLLDWIEKLKILQNIVMGLNDIHKNGLVHHNLNSKNILLSDNNVALIANFGLFELYYHQKEVKVSPYIAPEIFKKREYTQESDIYGFGTIIYEIYTGLLPDFNNIVKNNEIPINLGDKIPHPILETIKQCWDVDPLKRLKAVDLFKLFDKLLGKTYHISTNKRNKTDGIGKYLLKLDDTKSKIPEKCEKCGKQYIENTKYEWCDSCRNAEIYSLIQKNQLNIVSKRIPYDDFIEINEINGKDGFVTALWKDNSLRYYNKRTSYKKVILKYLHSPQDITEKFTNKVLNSSL
jgi:serine/threonine protein kinase